MRQWTVRSHSRLSARALPIGLAMAILALAPLGLLSCQPSLPWQAPDSAATTTAAAAGTSASTVHTAQTALAGATQTAAAHFPYLAPVPGADCDQGWAASLWHAYYTATQGGALTCVGGHAHFVTGSGCGQMCSNTGEFGIDLGRMSPPLPYTISIDVSHLSASASLILRLTGESADTTKEVFTLQTDGYGSARAIWCAVPCKGAGSLLGGWGAAPTARHTLTFAVDSSAVTVSLDQHQLGKAKQGASLAPIYLDFTLLSGNFTGVAPTGSVDLANFRVT